MNAVKRTLLLEVMKLVDANWSLDPNEMELMKFINFKGALTIETVMFYISGVFFVFFATQREQSTLEAAEKITEIYLKLWN